MQWSNLNEQMIQGFFQDSASPTSNPQISLNFTRTSRQSSQKKQNYQVDKQKINQPDQCQAKTKKDIITIANNQLSKIDDWMEDIRRDNNTNFQTFNSLMETNDEIDFFKLMSNNQEQSIKKNMIKVLDQSILIQKKSKLSYKKCQNCLNYQSTVKQLNTTIQQLQNKISSLTKQYQKNIYIIENEALQSKTYYQEEIKNSQQKNNEFQQTIQKKNQDISNLKDQIEKYSLERSTYHIKNKTLQNRLSSLQKSKGHSATKNSTSHTDFSKFPENSLIVTNQFSSNQKTQETQDYLFWFQKMKTIFIDQFKRDQRKHLDNYKGTDQYQKKRNQFKKSNTIYDVARSLRTLAEYIKKNKDEFVQFYSRLNRPLSKDRSLFHIDKDICGKISQQYEQQLKKQQKMQKGFQSQIINLNSQLSMLKSNLRKQKEQNKVLIKDLQNLKKKSEGQQNNALKAQFQEQIQCKNKEIIKLTKNNKKMSQSHQTILLQIKQIEYTLYKQRKQKIRLHNELLNTEGKVKTICKVKPKRQHQKHLSSIIHEFQGRLYIEKINPSYRFDNIIRQQDSSSELLKGLKMTIQNCIYGYDTIISSFEGSSQSNSQVQSRLSYNIVRDSMLEIFKIKENQKRFLNIHMSLQIVEMTETKIIDLLDFENANRRISIKKDHNNIYLSNCNILTLQKMKDFQELYWEAINQKRNTQSHVITMVKFTSTDKRNKDKIESKLIFTDLNFMKNTDENDENETLKADSDALWSAFNSLAFKQKYSQVNSNRLTNLLSDSLNKAETKCIALIHVSPTQIDKQESRQLLAFGSSIKNLEKKVKISESFLKGEEQKENCTTKQYMKHRSTSSQCYIKDIPTEKGKKRTISRLSIS